MHINKYRISKHAAQRMAQRNISVGDLAIVLKFGRKHHCTNAEIIFLREKDLPPGTEKQLSRLVGTFAVAVNDCVMTVVRNRKKGLMKIKRKPKSRRKRRPISWAAPATVLNNRSL